MDRKRPRSISASSLGGRGVALTIESPPILAAEPISQMPSAPDRILNSASPRGICVCARACVYICARACTHSCGLYYKPLIHKFFLKKILLSTICISGTFLGAGAATLNKIGKKHALIVFTF